MKNNNHLKKHVAIPDSAYDKLKTYCSNNGLKIGHFVGQAIEAYLVKAK